MLTRVDAARLRLPCKSYQRAKSDDLQDRFHEKEGGKDNVEVLQDVVVDMRCTVELNGTNQRRKVTSRNLGKSFPRRTHLDRAVPSSSGRWC